MQFSNFSRLEKELTFTLYNRIPIENVSKIINYTDNSEGIFSKQEFRWSFDGTYWSSWQTLSQYNISRIDTHNNLYLFLQIRYVLTAPTSGNVNTFSLSYLQNTVTTDSRDHSPDYPDSVNIDTLPGTAVVPVPESKYSVPATSANAETLNGYSGGWYLDRSHHIGNQPISTITGLQDIINNILSSIIEVSSNQPSTTVWGSLWIDTSI